MRGSGKRLPPLRLETAEDHCCARTCVPGRGAAARCCGFLALTGLDAGRVRARLGTPELLAAVLEHLAGDESLLLVFAASANVAPETVAPALALLQEAGRKAGRQ